MADNKAAFGVFPQMKPRRSKQDREASANIPVAVARGLISGTLGMPGDIESLARLPYELITGKESKTILPTSEDIEKRLPFRGSSQTPVGQMFTGASQLAGGAYTGPLSGARAVMAVPKAIKRAGLDFVQAAGQPAVNVIKPKGGNWLTGSVERALRGLKTNERAAENLEEMRRVYPPSVMGRMSPETVAQVERAFPHLEKQVAMNQWIDRNLTNYIKKEMATPEDPVRKLAEEGITHLPQDVVQGNVMWVPEGIDRTRSAAGFGELGKSDAAKSWENITDASINVAPASKHTAPLRESEIRRGYKSTVDNNPWLNKVDPNTPIYYPEVGDYRELGFDHIVDVLKQDLASGRIRPDQLNKVSMEQAVRRTYEFDQDMAKKMREAQIKATEGMPVVKEYPEGYKWIELTTPKGLKVPEGYKVVPDPITNRKTGEVDPNSYRLVDQEGRMVGWGQSEGEAISAGLGEKVLKDALKYEGDTMGHCVGGYCPDVLEGRSRIYSLRDAKGEPHVTIEVNPSSQRVAPRHEEVLSEMKASGLDTNQLDELAYDIEYEQALQRVKQNRPPAIAQIKGKQNRAPNEEYLPFVQDFVRSGQWSDVGDLKNTGLMRADAVRAAGWDMGDINQPFLTKQEYDDLLLRQLKPEGMKRGGSVSISDNADSQMMDVEDRKMGVGGLLRRGAKAAKSEPALPLELPRAPAKTREEIRPVAQRMAEQMTGEFVRPNPKKSINPAGKSLKQFKMEQDLTHDIRPVEGKTLLPQQVADIEKQLGLLKIGVSGDTTIADKVLHRAGPYQLDIPSPQHGGPLYGLGGEGAWASNNPVAATFQKRVQELSQAHKDAPVLGQFLAMGPQGSNFAMHFADANLRAIDPSKMSKQQIEQVNKLIREGSEKSGPRPGFPGIEDKESAYLHFAFDPELRKHFNAVMQQPDYTSKLGLPDGRVILHAITEPELRNTEVLTSGLSQMRLDPSVNPADLALSAHPTYSHVIPKVPGSDITRTRYPVPAELEFPDVAEFIKKEYRPRDATRVYQTATPRQIVDPQHIDEMKMYEELMKQYTGKKKGGAISEAAQIDGNEFVLAAQKYGLSDDMNTLNKLVALVNQGATVDKAARMIAETVEMAEGGKVKKPHDGLIKVTKKRKAKA